MNQKEIQEQLKDVQEVAANLGERLQQIEQSKADTMPQDITLLLQEFQWLKDLNQIQQAINEEYFKYIKQKLDEQPKPIIRNFRLLLFPDRNPRLYYTIVFGRLLPWGTLLVALTLISILGCNALGVYNNKARADTSRHYERAWRYLRQNASSKTVRAMDNALEKTE